MDKINVSRKDVLWGYVAQIFNVGANLFILPVLFYFLSSEVLGVWYIFMNIGTFITLFGLVFQSSFSRNISYAFGGATSLQQNDVDMDAEVLDEPNLPLIKGLIAAMRRFYGLISIGILVLLLGLGIPYISYLSGDLSQQSSIIVSWCLYTLSVAFGFYALYFGSILQGRGYMKELNQLTMLHRLVYVILVSVLVSKGYSIFGVVISNVISVIVYYILGYIFAYKGNLKKILKEVEETSANLMRIIWANTYKLGFATLFIYISTRGNLFYISLFLPLGLIAQYGLSLQVMNVLNTVSLMYFISYTPLVAQSWIIKDRDRIRQIYTKSLVICLLIFILGAAAVIIFGNWGLELIGSNTSFLPTIPLLLLSVVYLVDTNHSLALSLMISRNKIPHLKASIISAIVIFLLIPVFVVILDMGIYGAILAVGIVQLCYHNWKWPLVASHELRMSIPHQLRTGINSLLNMKLKNS